MCGAHVCLAACTYVCFAATAQRHTARSYCIAYFAPCFFFIIKKITRGTKKK